ncbi:MAG: aminotransferase class V-fold PLP-dependent enzyme [Candidatus Latescibacterota bacterium]|nr:aminotransferase class V-fold PLP-dependent enzyme [Candidatus Latescibacterota bacterium]
MSNAALALYAEMGATPVINAIGNRTFLGGSAPDPEVVAAMQLAGRYYVDMDAFLASTGRIVADLIAAEAALITPGCAAAIVLGTAACITGPDPDKMARLPDTTGLKNKVVIQQAQRYKYDRVARLPGTTLVAAGTAAGTTADELAAAIDDKTAMVLYPAIDNQANILSAAQTIAIAHAHDVPVFVDAAYRVYPLSGLTEYTAMGADLVGYGAKYFGAPNSSGILCGRQDLIAAAHLHSFACFETRDLLGIGRPLKIDRQEVVGVVVALQRWLAMDHDDRHAETARRADILRSYLGEISNSQISTGSSPTLTLTLDEQALGQTADEIQMALRNCNPAVWPDFSPGHLHFHMHSVQDGDEEMLAAKVKEILEAG